MNDAFKIIGYIKNDAIYFLNFIGIYKSNSGDGYGGLSNRG